jgi:hypothetical protein
MFFDDGSDDADRSAGERDDRGLGRAERLARDATGESVTAARLRGEEQYYPTCTDFLQDDQQPHHLVLLTIRDTAFVADRGGRYGETAELYNESGGVALLTEQEMLTVIDDVAYEVPYAAMEGVFHGGTVQVVTPGQTYTLYVASSADDAEIDAACDYLRKRARETNA